MGVPFCITSTARHTVSCKRNFIGFYWRLDKNCSVILERFILVPAEFKIPKAAVKLHKIISFHLHFFEKVKHRETSASLSLSLFLYRVVNVIPGKSKGGSITVPLTSCLTGLESIVGLLTIFVFKCKTELSKPVKQEVNGTMDTSPFSIPCLMF